VAVQLLVMHGDAFCFLMATVEGQQRKQNYECRIAIARWGMAGDELHGRQSFEL
jgi:hypothetical protein